ncbi:MAG: hypothetical protein HWE27_03790 [Gammaproteobacteria bacterium]|nr:hypothetical protein [Gammaproteobacteria bacterium]
MYIWNTNSLIQDLKNNNVSQKEQFKYALAFSVLSVVGSDPSLSIGLKYTSMDTISTAVMLVITIFGLIFCFKANEGVDGKDFILRFFTIGLPITIRFVAVFLPLSILIGFLEASLDPNYDEMAELSVTSLYQVIFIGVAQLIYYVYFASKFKAFQSGKID